MTIMLWDMGLTMDMEIEYVWFRKWSLGKVLFFLVSLPVIVAGNDCKPWNRTDISRQYFWRWICIVSKPLCYE